jgi:hypothetical protein
MRGPLGDSYPHVSFVSFVVDEFQTLSVFCLLVAEGLDDGRGQGFVDQRLSHRLQLKLQPNCNFCAIDVLTPLATWLLSTAYNQRQRQTPGGGGSASDFLLH